MNMAQNYATQWQKSIDQIFSRGSYVKQHLGTNGITFKDAKTVVIDTLDTFAPVNYNESAVDLAYGTPNLASNSEKTYTIAHNKAVSIRIPQTLIKDTPTVTAARYTKAELEEQFVPEYDAYALGKIDASVPAANEISYTVDTDEEKSYKTFLNLVSKTTNKRVPRESLVFFATSSYLNDVRNRISKYNDGEGGKVKNSAAMGNLAKVPVIEVPEDIMPAGTLGILASKKSVFAPVKVDEVIVHTKIPEFSGVGLNIRQRNDVFVFANKAAGLAAIKSA